MTAGRLRSWRGKRKLPLILPDRGNFCVAGLGSALGRRLCRWFGEAFNVHNGSRFSRTIQTIAELEPNATVVENGFTVSEQNVADAAGDVAAWLDELGY